MNNKKKRAVINNKMNTNKKRAVWIIVGILVVIVLAILISQFTKFPLFGPIQAEIGVFVTSQSSPAAFNNLDSADRFCQDAANNANLEGEWKAFLGDSDTPVQDRLEHYDSPYLRTDGVKIADNWDDLINGPGEPINTDENGNPAGSVRVFTGMLSDLSTAENCADWIKSDVTKKTVVGISDSKERWMEAGRDLCFYERRLYCFRNNRENSAPEPEICYDLIDNDLDSKTDCEDEDCDGQEGKGAGEGVLCEFGTELSCEDQFDNDADQKIDCLDTDCANYPICLDRDVRVFITSQQYTGDLGSLTGADQKCNDLANSEGLGGQWVAWLSSKTVSASERVTQTTNKYVLLDGTAIADNWEDLIDGSLNAPILITQKLKKLDENEGGRRAWTHTKSNGETLGDGEEPIWFEGELITALIDACNDWTSADSLHKAGRGEAVSVDGTWTYSGIRDCTLGSESRLYCFEKLTA